MTRDDWPIQRLGSCYGVRDEKAGSRADELPLMSVSQIHGVIPRSELVGDSGRAEDLGKYKVALAGDIVLNRMSAYNGALGVARQNGIVSPDYLVMTPSPLADPEFVAAWLKTPLGVSEMARRLRGIGSAEAKQVRTPRVNESDLRLIPIALPPIAEQRAIADYLARETARIDTLIEEQQRLIEMLQERRQAVIESAAGRGIDAAASMKSSGLSWIDKVPDHWVVANIRRFASMKTGHTPSRNNPDYWVDCTIPWFTLADVWQLRDGKRTYLGETESKISELGLANSAADLLPAETVVLSRTASVGFTGVMPEPMATSQDFWNWVPGGQLDSVYLMWVFRAMRSEFQALMIGSTHKTIYQPTAAAIRIPVPPMDEQRRIAAYLDEQTAKIDTLIAETEMFIELSRERRAALITAAVTGQIDVRGAA